MTRAPWQAPRTAYLLTAATAERDEAAGNELWAALGEQGEAEVLAALGAQCRAAIKDGMDRLRITEAEFSVKALTTEVCSHAIGALQALLSGGAWEAPQCPHCRKAIAGALAGMAVGASRSLGMSAEVIAHNCRRTAAKVATA